MKQTATIMLITLLIVSIVGCTNEKDLEAAERDLYYDIVAVEEDINKLMDDSLEDIEKDTGKFLTETYKEHLETLESIKQRLSDIPEPGHLGEQPAKYKDSMLSLLEGLEQLLNDPLTTPDINNAKPDLERKKLFDMFEYYEPQQ